MAPAKGIAILVPKTATLTCGSSALTIEDNTAQGLKKIFQAVEQFCFLG
jgi:hypothetical protein